MALDQPFTYLILQILPFPLKPAKKNQASPPKPLYILSYQPNDQAIEVLYFIIPNRRFKMIVADATMVRFKSVWRIGGDRRKPHEELRLFIDAAGRDRYNFNAFFCCSPDLRLNSSNRSIIVMGWCIQDKKRTWQGPGTLGGKDFVVKF